MEMPLKIRRLTFTAVLAALVFAAGSVSAQINASQNRTFEEIVVSFEVPKLIQQDLFVQFDGHTVYLPLVKIFNLLDLNIEADMEQRKFYGFFISKDQKYEIDLSNFRIKALGKEYPYLASDYYLGEDDLYVRVELLANLFNMRMTFDFTMLRVYVPLDKDFPAYQKLKRKIAREKLNQRIASLRDVVDLGHERKYLGGASMDWSISTNPIGGRNNHYYSLTTGGILFGGDFEVTTGGSNEQPFDPDQLTYGWHYFLSDNKYLSQATVGKVNAGGALGRGLDGVMLTNKPQERREYFQTIHLRDYVGEGWEVELWVDNKLADYIFTGFDGFYDFDADVFYGASNIEIKMYGPNGEMRTDQQVIRVPYTLLPKGEFEYNLAGGKLDFNQKQRTYAQVNGYYGVLSGLTLGVSYDMPVGADDGEKPVLATDATYQLFGNVTLNGAHALNYQSKASLSFNQPSLVSISAGYTKYQENTIRNPLNQLSKINFSISAPLKLGGNYFGLRYNISSDKYPTLTSMNMNFGFNASINPFHFTYMGKYKSTIYANKTIKSIASQIMLSSRLLRFLSPQIQMDYDHVLNCPSKYGVHLAKRIFKTSQITLSMEHNALTKNNTIMATFNLLTPFADFTSRVMQDLEADDHEPGGQRLDTLQQRDARISV